MVAAAAAPNVGLTHWKICIYGSTGFQIVATRFHHLMVVAVAGPKVALNQSKNFKNVLK